LWKHDKDDEGKDIAVGRQVWVIYGSMKPFDRVALAAALERQKAGASVTHVMADQELQAYLNGKPDGKLAPVLTDAYAPVDNLISVVYRKRDQ
jgi:hypothetical protein